MAPPHYHKFPAGERCEDCGARQWYAEDAIKYCRNGHRLEGFAEYEADEDAFQNRGQATKKRREKREKTASKLTGDEGRELYLDTLQFILIKQVRWLIDRKGLPRELEAVVKALWSLRVRDLPIRNREGGRGGKGKNKENAEEEVLFSTQAETSDGEITELENKGWKLPRPTDTLALCYLGCLLRGIPVTAANIYGWIQKEDLEYLAALNSIPPRTRMRLSQEYLSALQVKDHVEPGRIQTAVQNLAVWFNANFEIGFPPLNYVPILIGYITELTLPAETYLAAKCIGEVIQTDYSFPKYAVVQNKKKKIYALDNPEHLLITLVVVAAKLLYPLDGVERPPLTREDPRSTKFDWAKWQETLNMKTKSSTSQEPSGHLVRGEEYKVTANDILRVEKTKLDDYMDWFEKMWVGAKEPKTPAMIRDFFEEKGDLSKPHHNLRNEDAREHGNQVKHHKQRYKVINDSIATVDPVPDDASSDAPAKQPRNHQPIWAERDDLPPAAMAFYNRAAEVAVLPLETLVRCANQLERRIEVWCEQKTKEGKEREERRQDKGKGKAKGKAVADVENHDSDGDIIMSG